LPLVGIEPTTY